jgi:PadR family transcriptional regulator PadR
MKPDTQLVKGTVRLLVLRLLAREPMYGYQMIQVLREESGGYFSLGDGALYVLLHEMQAAGFLRPEWRAPEAGPPRRYYHLTPKGRRELARRTAEWQRFTQAATQVLEQGNGN